MKILIALLISTFSFATNSFVDEVDTYFQSNELTKVRNQSEFQIDKCHTHLESQNTFGETLLYFINELATKKSTFLHISSIYKMPTKMADQEQVGLLSHPLCLVTKESLSKTIKNMPDEMTIELANRFAREHNELREQEDHAELQQLWGKFFGCLAYTESLTTADLAASEKLAKKYAPKNYKRPQGVKFYYDKWQPKVSRLNIGLYQFTPNYGGNIKPCVDSWNHYYSNESCQIKNKKKDALINAFGSTAQHFNAYCGVHKVIEAFSVQLNTSEKKFTHPQNQEDGKLKSASERCVTPHFYAGWSYNHFGPLQNSTKNNLKKLMSCLYN